jgi:pyridoxine 5'-phosphate synthase PdxJ
MTKLSVNINKIATLRNVVVVMFPNLFTGSHRSTKFGAQGITII